MGASFDKDDRGPFGHLGALAHPIVRVQLARIFAYRQNAVRRALLPAAGDAPQ